MAVSGDDRAARRELARHALARPAQRAVPRRGRRVRFRGSTRFHVPGHKGGAGADPGAAHGDRRGRAHRSTSRRTSTASTSGRRRRRTSARSSSPPRPTARRARSSSPTAPRRATTRSASRSRRSARRSSCSATRTRRSIDGLVLSRRAAELRRARVRRRSSAWRTASRPSRSRRRSRATPDARAAFIVSPTYYGMAADVAGCAEVAHARRRAARRRPVLGPALRLPPRPAADGAARRAPTRCSPRRTRSPARSRRARCCTSAGTGRVDPDAVARALRLLRSTSPVVAADAPRSTRARRQLALHGEAAAVRARSRRSTPRARGDRRRSPGCARGRRRAGRAPGRRRLRPAADRASTSAAPAAPATRSPPRCARTYDVHVELATQATIVLVARPRRARRRARALRRTTSTRSSRRIERPGETAALVRGRRRVRQRGRRAAARGVPRRGRAVAVDDAVGPRLAPSRSPATRRASPRCCRASGSPPSVIAYLRELRDVGARLHGASDPSFETICAPGSPFEESRHARMRPWTLRRIATRTLGNPEEDSLRIRAAPDSVHDHPGRADLLQRTPAGHDRRRADRRGPGGGRRGRRRDDRGDRRRRRARPCHDHPEGARRDLRPRASRRPSSAASTPTRRSSGSGPRASGARPARRPPRRGLGARAADRRADRAELPRPPVGHRDARPRRSSRAIAGAGGEAQLLDTRKTTPGPARAREARRAPTAAASTTAPGSDDSILIKENHAALAGGVGEAVRRARGRGRDLPLAVEVRDAGRDRRGARRRRAAAAARQHEPGRAPRRGRPGGRSRASSRPPAASTLDDRSRLCDQDRGTTTSRWAP